MKVTNYNQLLSLIKRRRLQLRLSWRGFARLSGTSLGHVQRLLGGLTKPTAPTLLNMCKAVDLVVRVEVKK
jgi:transcriptional regulator with XRE-family HTH domain